MLVDRIFSLAHMHKHYICDWSFKMMEGPCVYNAGVVSFPAPLSIAIFILTENNMAAGSGAGNETNYIIFYYNTMSLIRSYKYNIKVFTNHNNNIIMGIL